MDVPKAAKKPNPCAKANVFSRLVFYWFWPVFQIGYKGQLKKERLWDPPQDTEATYNTDKLQTAWESSCNDEGAKTKEPAKEPLQANTKENVGYARIRKALIATFGMEYVMVWPLIIFNDCVLRVIQPWFMLLLVRSFIVESSSPTCQYVYAAGICLSTLVLTLTNNPCQYYLGKLGQRCRISLASLIQRKVERVRIGEERTDEGQIINLLSNDTFCIENNIGNLAYLLVAPLQLVVFMWFLYIEFGLSCLAGVAFILVYLPFQYWNGSLSTLFKQKIAKKTDERVRVLSEVINAIHLIKMYAWEHTFQKIIQRKRKSEVKQLGRRSALHAFQMSIFLTSSRVVPFLTFAVFVLSGGPLTADRVFYAVAVYNTVTHFMVFMLPGAIRGLGEIRGSLQRIERFLLLDEKPENDGAYTKVKVTKGTTTHYPVKISFASAAPYQKTGGSPMLSNISCKLKQDSLVMIVGKVGSGKSSFLNLILNELRIIGGTVKVSDSISYCSQEPFLFPGSIKRNILFKTEDDAIDEKRFDQVIHASGLGNDIQDFNLSVKGLSGGQRARVNLARSLYHQADVYLLDDPLSSLDGGVGRHVVENGLKTFLRGKLRILVTNQLHLLGEADHVIVMKNGSIERQGTYNEVAETVQEIFGANQESGDVDSLVKDGAIQKKKKSDDPNETSIDMEEEEEDVGGTELGLGIYLKYFASGKSKSQLIFYLFIFILAQVFTTIIEYWLAIWTNAEERMYEEAKSAEKNITLLKVDNLSSFEHFITNVDNLEQNLYLYIYLILTTIVFLTNLAKAVAFFYFCMRICRNLHEKMLRSLMRAKPSFFDNNPCGRILNRFTKDMNVIDEAIPLKYFDMFTIFLQVVTVIFLIIFAIWYSFVAVVIFLIALGLVRGYYVKTSRDLKRIEGATRSPVLTHIQSTYSGLLTIRALKAEGVLSEQFDYLQDRNTSATISFLVASQCFNIWIETLATILLTFVAFGFLIAQNYIGMQFQGGNVGLAICSAVSLTIWLQYGMKTSAEVENFMISVERAVQYTKLEPEAELETSPGDREFLKGWPSKGEVSFKQVHLSYDGQQDILRNLSFTVKSGEKVGAVGQTGAGKSSIFRAFFRTTEIRSGVIYIDDKDVSKIGLHDLRKNIAIIPQHPQLFKGTLAFNLDPSIETDAGRKEELDRRMRQVLNMIGLEAWSLEHKIESKGSNLCPGERQLISLARVLITPKRIVCLDEATSQIDIATDQVIQRVFRTELKNSTVITVAHRLETVMDSDKILVLSQGQLVEFGPAQELLQIEGGHLATMVNNTGKDAEGLRRKALEAYQRIRQSGGEPNGIRRID